MISNYGGAKLRTRVELESTLLVGSLQLSLGGRGRNLRATEET